MTWVVEVRSLDNFPASREGFVPLMELDDRSEAIAWKHWTENVMHGPTTRIRYIRPDGVSEITFVS